MRRIAILLSTPSFEQFFGKVFCLTPQKYAREYRNDFAWYYAAMFQSRGIAPLIYIASESSSQHFDTVEGVRVRLLKLDSWYKLVGSLPIWRTPLGRYAGQVLNAWAFSRALRDALDLDDVDVLYIQEYWTGRFDLLAMSFAKRICIVGSDHGGYRDRNINVFKRLSFARVTALTSQTRDEVDAVGRFGTTATYLPNPLDTDFFSPSGRPRKDGTNRTILTVARLENNQKRITDLIGALAHLADEWSLTVAGEGSDRAMLERVARDLGVAARVNFLGFIGDREKLRSLYWSCDVFCLPSAFEGLPMVVLEAMSCACPVVVTAIPAYRDLVTSNVDGLEVPVGNCALLAAAINAAFAESGRLGAAARERIVAAHSQASFMRTLEEAVPLLRASEDDGLRKAQVAY
jgi:glycosyltransferase involved in cell wall biosynthesis